MADNDKRMLRGKEPMTIWRGAGGSAGGNLYRGGLIDPNRIDPGDRERLVAEQFLEWVVRDGEGWKLAEDTPTGNEGDPVSVGDAGLRDPQERDPGTINVDPVPPPSQTDSGVDAKREAARSKLDSMGGVPDGRASKDVLVEYLVRQGGSYDDLAKADKADLVEMVKSRQQ